MVYLYPRFYNCSVPAAFTPDLSQLAQLCEGSKPRLASDRNVEHLSSIKGEKFVSFVKSEHFVDGKISLIIIHLNKSAVFGILEHLLDKKHPTAKLQLLTKLNKNLYLLLFC